MTREAIVAEARRWIGTPYVHQASLQGAGCDCLGLLRGIWREVYGAEPETPPPYSRDWDEVSRAEVLMEAARRHLLVRTPEAMAAGDVILFRMRAGAVAKHLGVCSGTGDGASFIHAYARHGVVENALSAPWRQRIAAVFEFPGVF